MAIARKIIRVFRLVTAPLDWLEFGAFALVALGVGILIISAFAFAFINAAKDRDWLKAIVSFVPLLLLVWAVIKSRKTKTINWVLAIFVVLVSAVAFYFIYL